MDAYDLQDTLVHINYNALTYAELITNINNARLIYRPLRPFTIITAQEPSTAIRQAIREMVAREFPNCRAVYFVEGSEATVARAKAGTLRRINASSFTDNNRRILAAIRRQIPGLPLYIMTPARKREPYDP